MNNNNEKPIMDMTVEELHERGLDCEDIKCQECCQHDETDHDICMYCGKELDPGVAIDRAHDYNRD